MTGALGDFEAMPSAYALCHGYTPSAAPNLPNCTVSPQMMTGAFARAPRHCETTAEAAGVGLSYYSSSRMVALA